MVARLESTRQKMLRQLRENSRSVIIWVLLGIIIAFFVISFGPQASQDQFSCAGGSKYVVEVDGTEVAESSWRFGINGRFGGTGREGSREAVVDLLIERELLAQAAEAAGFRISDEAVDQAISKGEIYILGARVPPRQTYISEDGVFDYEILERWVGAIGLSSVAAFRDEQKREMLANAYRQLLVSGARVSPEEVLTSYRNQNTTVSFDFVKFEPKRYERGLALTAEQIDTYLASHQADVKKRYEQDERLYKGVSPQVRARHIFIEREKLPPPLPMPGTDAGAAPVDDPTLDPAHARVTAARARIEGGEDFAKVAAELSEDARTKDRGGDLGWRSVASLGWGPELSEAAKSLEKGALSDIVTTRRGFHILVVEDKREGDLAFDQVKAEIADKMAVEEYARIGARQDAQAALDNAKTSGKKLSELYPAPEMPAPPIPGAPSLPPVQIEPKTGMVTYEGPVQLASYGVAMQAPTAAADDKPADAADDALPEPVDVPRPTGLAPPQAQSSGAMPRSSGGVLAGPGGRPYVGKSPELQTALFETIEPGALGDKVYEVDDGYVIVQLTTRNEPDMEQFDKQKDRLVQSLVGEKSQRIIDTWSAQRCRSVAKAGDINVNASYVTYFDKDGKEKPVTYKVCMSLPPPQ